MASEPGAEILAWSRVNRQEGPLGSGCKHAAIDLGYADTWSLPASHERHAPLLKTEYRRFIW